ncbi:ClpP/crotonase-like domain-containing protein [Ilyonectria robusta]|uniref:ClpP/crotonase-like domain-containing protein n=1 Tax=Ilyonectria robusta TaxID=1079257 RepID=UPI001E8EF0B9|nr:ClpP/crotonase-like domain-containing protein [Ilyonectria robusta]KAH8736567.1 ClpP/crotonase-like domain-containing protein [Ilyonectria robusta]
MKHCLVSFPSLGILLVLINRPLALNCLSNEASNELDSVFRWFDREQSLRVAVISGVGKAFCVGADLKEWMANHKKGISMKLPENGFGGLSLRGGKKPVIAAVNGPAYGGGCEMAVNCDMVVASSTATFGLPEVKRGVTPFAGALPRIMRTAGKQRATELALTGRPVSAQEFKDWGLCNHVVEEGKCVVEKAIEYAKMIANNSPDASIVTRQGLKLGWEALGVVDASRVFLEGWSNRIYDGPNMQEGLDAFTEKREPRWKDSKL